MSKFRKLSTQVAASPQITAEDVATAAREGFSMIINNRPDGEEDGQPSSTEIGAAAQAHGLAYRYIPVTSSGMTPERIAETVAALEEAGGRTLAYCRSGTRSTFLWALAEASRGASPQELIEAADAAGYNISMIAGVLTDLSNKARQ
ncbi:TIGR01244 family sulfur transferase [Aurantiacibacter sp. MUD11]|uniref:TIGR01244 family sulfur transferase n=1 Tax=Aurantiacibacter sp. MUD11 TaxID=3003265 RepID=UPI0022AA0A05|nr:TIGR01244 family sulfur transferase [Aurantiacibacter sp. MUD11]WAT17319.1 TIGR01244 family sulfur transferase [Aurantiacibacter sp. MUD11]